MVSYKDCAQNKYGKKNPQKNNNPKIYIKLQVTRGYLCIPV